MAYESTHYTYRVRWSEEDQGFIATVAEFPSLSWFDIDNSAAYNGIVNLVKEVIEDMECSGEAVPVPMGHQSYSGRINLRMPPDQHRQLAIRAAEEGVSLNRLMCSLLSQPPIAAVERSSTAQQVEKQEVQTNKPDRSKTASFSYNDYSRARSDFSLVGEGESSSMTASPVERLDGVYNYDWPEEM